MSQNPPVLLRARLALGLTQVEVARRADIGHSYLSLLERGERKSMSAETLVRLCRALQLSAEERAELEAQLVPLLQSPDPGQDAPTTL